MTDGVKTGVRPESSVRVVSKHFTRGAADRAVADANAKRWSAGRSSGHKRIDHVVRNSGKLFRRYEVVERSR